MINASSSWPRGGSNSIQWLCLIVAIFVGLGIAYNIATPIFETPDEVWHYAYVRELAIYHRLPVVDADGAQPYRHEGLQPPLYYAMGSVFISWMNGSDLESFPPPNPFARIGDPRAESNDNRNAFLHQSDDQFPLRGTTLAVHLIRLFSTLLGAITIVATFALARELFPQQITIALGAAAFIALLPQFIFISSAISNDNLATALTASALYLIVRIARRGMNLSRVLVLGILVSAALLTKLTTIALSPLVLIVLAHSALKERNWRSIITNGAILAALVALIAGWWYFRNLFLYGDLTTFGRLAGLVGERPHPLSFWRWLTAEGEGLRLSTWGVFGWFNIRASSEFYFFFDGLALLGAIGIAIAIYARRNLSIGMGILALWCGLIVFSFWGYASNIITSQGRLLFPALPAWAIFWSWGIATLAPSRFRSWVVLGIAGFQVMIAALVPWFFIAPAYAPRIIRESSVPLSALPLNWQFDNGVEWLGASIDSSTMQPGKERMITIYYRLAPGPVPKQATFIHIINSAGAIIAQRDSFVGSGNPINLPTSEIVADSYNIDIPVTVPAPDEWQIRIGMYDLVNSRRSTATDQSGRPLGDELTLLTIPASPAKAESWNFDFDGRTRLTRVDLEQNQVTQGGTLSLTLHWLSSNNADGLDLFVHALGQDDKLWASAESTLDTTKPTLVNLKFDPKTPPGLYQVEVGIYPPPDGSRLAIFDHNGQDFGDRIMLGPVRVVER
jgi:hypothetical protein